MVKIGVYGDVVIISGEFKGVKGRYIADLYSQQKALMYPFSNQDFEIAIPHKDIEYLKKEDDEED